MGAEIVAFLAIVFDEQDGQELYLRRLSLLSLPGFLQCRVGTMPHPMCEHVTKSCALATYEEQEIRAIPFSHFSWTGYSSMEEMIQSLQDFRLRANFMCVSPKDIHDLGTIVVTEFINYGTNPGVVIRESLRSIFREAHVRCTPMYLYHIREFE